MQESKSCDDRPKRPTRKPVEVVEFTEPGKNRSQRPGRKRKLKDNKMEDKKEDFASIFDDVKEFGITGLSKRERKKIYDQKMQSLGAKKQKGQKTPYPILQKALKIRREREKQQEELEKEMGMFTKKKKAKTEKKSIGHGGWWKDEPIKLDTGKNNIKIRASDVKSFSKRAK
eukprot:gene7245-8053_t